MRSVSVLLMFLSLLVPVSARAHPHEFIDTGITFRFDDQGKLGAIGVVWTWDEFTSMLILEDFGLDGDGDGVLTDDEREATAARFSAWPDTYECPSSNNLGPPMGAVG